MRKYVIIMGLIACVNMFQAGDDDTSKRARLDMSSKNIVSIGIGDTNPLSRLSSVQQKIFLAYLQDCDNTRIISSDDTKNSKYLKQAITEFQKRSRIPLATDMKCDPIKYSSSTGYVNTEEMAALDAVAQGVDAKDIEISYRRRPEACPEHLKKPVSSYVNQEEVAEKADFAEEKEATKRFITNRHCQSWEKKTRFETKMPVAQQNEEQQLISLFPITSSASSKQPVHDTFAPLRINITSATDNAHTRTVSPISFDGCASLQPRFVGCDEILFSRKSSNDNYDQELALTIQMSLQESYKRP